MQGTGKKTRGRQKIELKKIENDDARLITFSKRRSGIYKKASELVIMCGADVGLFIFSPTEKAFSFGYPSVESITGRFLNRNANAGPVADDLQPMIHAFRRVRMDKQNKYFSNLLNWLDEAKKRGNALRKITRATSEGASANRELGWWEKPLDELSPSELAKEMAEMEGLHKNLSNYLNHPVNIAALGLANPMVEPIVSNDPPSGSRKNVED